MLSSYVVDGPSPVSCDPSEDTLSFRDSFKLDLSFSCALYFLSFCSQSFFVAIHSASTLQDTGALSTTIHKMNAREPGSPFQSAYLPPIETPDDAFRHVYASEGLDDDIRCYIAARHGYEEANDAHPWRRGRSCI